MLRSWIACISLSFEHLIACNESQLCHSVFWSWSTSALCSWYQAKQWIDMYLNQYNCFSSICIILLSESFWTALNDTCVLCMRWINSLILRSVLWDSLKALCLKYLKHLMLCLLHFIFCDAWIEWDCQKYEWFCNVVNIHLRRWEKELFSQYLDFFLERRYHMINVTSLQWWKLRKLFR